MKILRRQVEGVTRGSRRQTENAVKRSLRRIACVMTGPESERGAGTVLVLGVIAAVLLLTGGISALGIAQNARGAAQTAADLGALAGAAALRDGFDECARVTAVVERNGAAVTSCALPDAGVVRVEVRRAADLPGNWSSLGTARASARAGIRGGGAAWQGLGDQIPPAGATGATGAARRYGNGQIPAGAMCELPFAAGQRLRCDAAAAASRLNAAFHAAFGRSLSVTDAYRSYADQVAVKASKGALAAPPGMSNHGWGQALDLGGGIQSFGTAEYRWMRTHASRFGWIHPVWAEPGGSKPEPWHWEYGTGG